MLLIEYKDIEIVINLLEIKGGKIIMIDDHILKIITIKVVHFKTIDLIEDIIHIVIIDK